MPKKNDETEGEAPVKKAPPDYNKLQSTRRELEAELSIIDTRIREAMNSGDLASLDKLVARKAELPRLFIVASNAERQARREKFNAEDDANLKALAAAEAARNELREAMAQLHTRHLEELTSLKAELDAAEAMVSEAYNAVGGARALGAIADAGFGKSLAALTNL